MTGVDNFLTDLLDDQFDQLHTNNYLHLLNALSGLCTLINHVSLTTLNESIFGARHQSPAHSREMGTA